VGIGGVLDCTNLVPKPCATGITALGLDHVAILGSTLAEIAAAKAGIYKVRQRDFSYLLFELKSRSD